MAVFRPPGAERLSITETHQVPSVRSPVEGHALVSASRPPRTMLQRTQGCAPLRKYFFFTLGVVIRERDGWAARSLSSELPEAPAPRFPRPQGACLHPRRQRVRVLARSFSPTPATTFLVDGSLSNRCGVATHCSFDLHLSDSYRNGVFSRTCCPLVCLRGTRVCSHPPPIL